MKSFSINLSDIKVRRPTAPSTSYHRDKKQEAKNGGSRKHPKRSFQSYLD